MKFEEVLPALRQGKNIKRECQQWLLNIRTSNANPSLHIMIPILDILSDDWEIIDDHT